MSPVHSPSVLRQSDLTGPAAHSLESSEHSPASIFPGLRWVAGPLTPDFYTGWGNGNSDLPSHLSLILLLRLFCMLSMGEAHCNCRGQKSRKRALEKQTNKQTQVLGTKPGLSGRAAGAATAEPFVSLAHLTCVLTKGRRLPCLRHTPTPGASKLLTPIINNTVVQDPLGIGQEGFGTAVHLLLCILGEAREHYDHQSLYRQHC